MANIGNAKYDLFKVDKILIGDPGVDLDEAQMDTIPSEQIVPQSVSIVKPQATETNVETEGNDTYRTLTERADPDQVNFAIYGLPLEQYPVFFGGSYDAVAKTWDAPDAVGDIFKSVIVYTGETDAAGTKLKAVFPYCKITAGFDGNLTKNAIKSVTVTCTANKPVGMSATYKFRIAEVAA